MASGSRTNVTAVGALLLMNILMSINQTNIASLNLPISLEFHQTLFGLGLLSAGFFVAYGLFELPGGILAFRIGAKKLLVVGGLVTSAAVIASAASPSFAVLIALRFLAGMGLGFSFPPIVVLVIRNLRAGSTGLGAALVSTSFSISGGVGVFGWAVLSVALGWRDSVLIGGALCLLSTIVVILLLPADPQLTEPTRMISDLKRVVFNRQLLIICLAFVGAGSATALVGNFMVYYLEQHLGLGEESAGLIGGLTYVLPLLSSPFFGRLYDRGRSEKRILLSGVTLLAVGMGITALDSVLAAIVSVLVVGLATGIFFTVGFSAARDRAPTREIESFTVGFVDSFSFVGFFLSPLYFSVIVLDYGYPSAWLAGSIVAILLAAPLVFLKGRKEVDGSLVAQT
ncbi:MAG: MFS transporter [Thaumarchaeota archaeon]|nr:MFS transporter [Nitrososphaerota archaeon]